MLRRVARQSVAAAGIRLRTSFCRSFASEIGLVIRPRTAGWKPGSMIHANPRLRAAVRLAGRRPLRINPALRAWHPHKQPRVETREHDPREPAASCRGSLGGPPPAWNQPGPPGLASAQKAPGGNPGTCCTRTRGFVPRFAWRAAARLESTRPSGPGIRTKSPGWKPGSMIHANPRHRAAVRLAGRRPLRINPALRAWHPHKKPRVETRGHRV
jgi:hypothetical protein